MISQGGDVVLEGPTRKREAAAWNLRSCKQAAGRLPSAMASHVSCQGLHCGCRPTCMCRQRTQRLHSAR